MTQMISTNDAELYEGIKRRLEDPNSAENKIVLLDITAVRPYTNNPKVHSKDEIKVLADEIDKDGLLNPILVNKNTMEIIAGHKRYYAFKQLKRELIPARLFDVTLAEARVMRIVENQMHGKRYDTDILKTEILELKNDGLDIDNLGFDEKELGKFLSDFEEIDVEAFTANLDDDIDRQSEESEDDIKATDTREVSLYKIFGFKNFFVRDERTIKKFVAFCCEKYNQPFDKAFVRFVEEFNKTNEK